MNILHTIHNLYTRHLNDRLTTLLSNKMACRSEIKERSQNIIYFDNDDEWEIPTPRGIQSVPGELADSPMELSAPEPFVLQLSDIEVVGPDAVSILQDHSYVLENSVAKPYLMTDSIARTIMTGSIPARLPNSTVIDDPIVSLSGIQVQAYFHWFADYLPRIRWIEAYIDATGNSPDILIPNNPAEWLIKSLQMIGVPEDKILMWHGGRIRADNLVIPSIGSYTYPSADKFPRSIRGLRWVGNRIKNSVEIDTDMPPNIFISRGDASSRRISNDSEVSEIINKYGFETVELSQWNFRSQVKLFSQAKNIISPHGAGLINTIYARDLNILELFGSFVTPLYYQICSGLDHNYHFLLCDSVPIEGTRKIKQSGRDDEDLYVNPASLDQAIKNIYSE